MDAESVIKNLAGYLSSKPSKPKLFSQDFLPEEFLKRGKGFFGYYSTEQIEAMYGELKVDIHSHLRQEPREPCELAKVKSINVFELVEMCADKLLVEADLYGVECEFNHILFWRDLSHKISEDVFTTAFLAKRDSKFNYNRQYYSWPVVIRTNNIRLKNLLSKGLADNHFHLKASNPVFDWQWIHMMNHIFSEPEHFEGKLNNIGKNFLSNDTEYYYIGKRRSLFELSYLAAAIRLALYIWLNCSKSGSDFLMNHLKYLFTVPEYGNLLFNDEALRHLANIRFDDVDYAMPSFISKEDYRLMEGERYIMYSVYREYFTGAHSRSIMCEFFYLYLLIKIRVRKEFIQVNNRYGFDNFSEYDDRKADLLPTSDAYRCRKYYYSISDTLKTQSVVSLEARIVPPDTIKGLRNIIKEIDNATLKDKFPSLEGPTLAEALANEFPKKKELPIFNKDVFYVPHFPKQPDINEKELLETYEMNGIVPLTYCRHHKYREDLRKVAEAIVELRNDRPDYACRILGIDACSNEFYCRPEVFAVAYRYLSGHRVNPNQYFWNSGHELKKLKMAYHVGEDFYDLVDGLRAIEEAVQFLNLGEGSRVGHALALGTEVRYWYSQKQNLIMMPRQNFIDNLVWLHSRIHKYNIPDCHFFCNDLESLFKKHYGLVYGFSSKEDKNKQEDVSIQEYFAAWKLRGHDPYLYKSGKLNKKHIRHSEWDHYLFNHNYGEEGVPYKIDRLYYRYHFDNEVKVLGTRKVHYNVEEKYISVVEQLQECMQKFISKKHIGIETNPSSNVIIGGIPRYDEHPIQKWYNVGLTSDNELLRTSPQSFISINTDDQGVFNTCLENEYALLACALEKKKGADGKPFYNQAQIYDWLDNIRRMGLQQSFRLIDFSGHSKPDER